MGVFTSLVQAQDKRVCITIDDLPCVSCGADRWPAVTDGLLTALEAHHVPGIGFVNEGKLYRDGVLDTARLALLDRWMERGQELGNHTFSHGGANALTIAAYATDIEKGEELTRPLVQRHGRQLRYFRHPFLFTGQTLAYQQALDSTIATHGYTVAPVTFDNDEYMYAFCYERARQANDTARMHSVAAQYVAYMDTMVAFHEEQAHGFLGRDIPHILLVHANALNADHLGVVLANLERRGYRFVPLSEALADPAYALPVPVVKYGFSWIRRWMLAAGLKPAWPPEPDPEIVRQFEERK